MSDLMELALDQVHDSPNQPRLFLSAEVRKSVKAGIEGNGGAYPSSMAITVRPRAAGGYEILAGHHRTQAARELGLGTIWAFVRDLGDKEALMLQAASNGQRSMSPVELGRHALMMRDQHEVSVPDYARAIGKSEATVYTYIRAYQVLEQYGGIKGPFAAVPAQALAALHGVPDAGFVSGLLYQFKERGTTGPVAAKVIDHCKEGKPMWQAFNLAEGRDEAPPAPVGLKTRGADYIPGQARPTGTGKASSAGMAAGASAAMLVHQNNEVLKAYGFTLALYQARCEELEARFGDQLPEGSREAFNTAVEARMKRILEESML
jgi:ParB/RepB/Spo0J family partition protein